MPTEPEYTPPHPSKGENANPKQSSEGQEAQEADLRKRSIPAKDPKRFEEGREVNLPKFELHWTKGESPLDEDPNYEAEPGPKADSGPPD